MIGDLRTVGMRGLRSATVAAALVFVAVAMGCQPPRAEEGGFESADPASKLYAIHRAGMQSDANAVPQLIGQLDSDDPAVRMYAIVALEKITGQRKGYSPYDPPHKRAAAVQRWAREYRQANVSEPDPSTTREDEDASS